MGNARHEVSVYKSEGQWFITKTTDDGDGRVGRSYITTSADIADLEVVLSRFVRDVVAHYG